MNEEIYFIECPFEIEGSDKIRSCEVNITTDECYCYNCGEYGNINNFDDELQETIYHRISLVKREE